MNAFLIKHYGAIGDTKLAEMFEKKFPKHFPWTKKQIEKRRGYMGLKRSPEQENRLRVMNNKDGRQWRMWEVRGRMKDGDVREWAGVKWTKVDGKAVPLHRQAVGAKRGEVVRRCDGVIQVVSRAEHAIMNKSLYHLPHDLRTTIYALRKLKRAINGKEHTRP